MDQLGSSKAKGKYAHQGMLLASATGPLSSLVTPFKSVLGSTTLSAKHKLHTFDSSIQSGLLTQSNSLKKKKKETTTKLLMKVIDTLNDLNNNMDKFVVPPLPPSSPLLLPLPLLPASALQGCRALATGQLLKDAREPGNEWLSKDEAYKVIKLFQKNEKVANFYLEITKKSRLKSFVAQWVWGQLASANL